MTAALVALSLLVPLTADNPDAIDRALNNAAVATMPAVRLNPPVVVDQGTALVPPCDQARGYRIEAGLPAVFDALTYRESRCSNTAISPTGCCVGLLQINKVVFRDHRMIPLIDANCAGATWFDIRGNTPDAKHAQMCVAMQLYSVDGLRPWRRR